MRYASVCSGVSPHSKEFAKLGWEAVFFSEIERFPSAVLAHHYPDVPNLGDMTKIDGLEYRGKVDVLLASCPCQAFSVAGLRNSLSDERGNLTLEFCKLADAIDPRVIVYENVPGILNTADNAFGCFLGALVGAGSPLVPGEGQRWTDAGLVVGPQRSAAWRVFDAQYFGLAQRRRRVFVVASAGDGCDPSQVLLIEEGVRRHTPPSREAWERVTGTISARTEGGGGLGTDFECTGGVVACADIAPTLNAHFGEKLGLEDQHINGGAGLFVTHSLRGEGFDASEDGTGRGTPLVPVLMCNREGCAGGARVHCSPRESLSLSPLTLTTKCCSSQHGGSFDRPIPIHDMATRHAGTDGSGHDCGKGHGLGIGGPEDPMFTLTKGDHHSVLAPLTGRDQHAVAFQMGNLARGEGPRPSTDTFPTLQAQAGDQHPCVMHPVAFHENQRAELTLNDTAGSLKVGGGKPGQGYPAVMQHMAVRRLLVTECCRLMGWDSTYLHIPTNSWRAIPADDAVFLQSIGMGEYVSHDGRWKTCLPADGPMYKTCGNGWCTPILVWIARRVEEVLR